MKRFYNEASAQPAADREGWYRILLDGKPVKSPAKADLLVPGQDLTQSIVTEWADQAEQVLPETMPMMTFAATATDRVEPQREAVAAEVAGYGASDLLCYRADQQPDLLAKQQAAWDPLLGWAKEAFGCEFVVTDGLMPVAQPNSTLMLLAREVGRMDSHRLTALHTMVSAMGSLILGLSVLHKYSAPEEAFRLSQVDEDHQADLWGRDEEAEARRARLRAEVETAHRFLGLLPP